MAVSDPRRIQRRRVKGWRMPANTVYVGRPTKWGNPHDWHDWLEDYRASSGMPGITGESWCRDRAVQAFQEDLDEGGYKIEVFKAAARAELRGKNLACWCDLNQSCHADVLLEVANA